MSVFGNFFNKNKSQQEKQDGVNWLPLISLEQLNEIKAFSKTETILIFKHSTRCIISKMVIKQFENSFNNDFKNVKTYYLDLLNYRAISNEISAAFNVVHQSPQLLVIKNGIVVTHASHHGINEVDIASFLK